MFIQDENALKSYRVRQESCSVITGHYGPTGAAAITATVGGAHYAASDYRML